MDFANTGGYVFKREWFKTFDFEPIKKYSPCCTWDDKGQMVEDPAGEWVKLSDISVIYND